jgi:hypothetical protein
VIANNLIRRGKDGQIRVDTSPHNPFEDESLIESLEQPVRGFSILINEANGFPMRAYFLPLFCSSDQNDISRCYPVWTPTLRITIRPAANFDIGQGKLFATCTVEGRYIFEDNIAVGLANALLLPSTSWPGSLWYSVCQSAVDDINDGGISRIADMQRDPDDASIGGLHSLSAKLQTSKNAGLLKIATLWNYWESRRDNKLLARADDINALGLAGLTKRGGPMREDNLQKICRDAGLAVGKSLPVVGRLSSLPSTMSA